MSYGSTIVDAIQAKEVRTAVRRLTSTSGRGRIRENCLLPSRRKRSGCQIDNIVAKTTMTETAEGVLTPFSTPFELSAI